MNQNMDREIAVIGMACKFPDAENVGQFWQNICSGKESPTFYSKEEVLASGVPPGLVEDPAYVYTNGCEIRDKFGFDAEFFNYTAEEALLMDPQIRITHECVYHALSDAGYAAHGYKGNISLFSGCSSNLQWEILGNLSDVRSKIGEWSANHYINKDFAQTLVSFKLGLKGPAVNVDTACSSSLVALHMAVRSLMMGECDMAIAGGASVNVSKRKGYLYSKGLIVSPDGHCRAFDKDAAGVIPGEGAGMVVLKRLGEALKDKDHIYAIVKGSCINNDGNRKVGYTAPGLQGQVEVIQGAMRFAGVTPESIGFIETHGTGTNLGDQVEIEALKKAFNTSKKNYCFLGASKTNIGHLDAAAGIAGFIKAVLVVNKKVLPPVANLKTVNPLLGIGNSPFTISDRCSEWITDEPRRAGVSSFGIGGTNAHVILEEWHKPQEPPESDSGCKLLLLSARTKTALEASKKQIADLIGADATVRLSNLAFTLQTGREHLPWREAVVFADRDGLMGSLQDENALKTALVSRKNRKIVFAFPGQGMQYVDMGKELYRRRGPFRESLLACFELLKDITGKDFEKILYPPERSGERSGGSDADEEPINQTANSQAILFSFEYALARMVESWGLRPDALIGHSIGELVAACLSGVFSLDQALRLVVKRGLLMQQMEPGDMLAINAGWKEVLKRLPSAIAIASINSPNHCVLSGPAADIAAFNEKMSSWNMTGTILQTSHAFHSQMMVKAAGLLEGEFEEMEFSRPGIPFISNTTGDWADEEDCRSIHYWSAQLRNTVQLDKGISRILEDKDVILLELGPGGSISNFAVKNENYRDSHKAISLIKNANRRNISDHEYLLSKAGEIWLSGVDIDWGNFHQDDSLRRISLPGYPFVRKLFKLNQDMLDEMIRKTLSSELDRKKPVDQWFYAPTWKKRMVPSPKIASGAQWLIIGFSQALVDTLEKHWKSEGQEVVGLCMDVASIRKPSFYTGVLSQFNKTDQLNIIDTTFLSDRPSDPDAVHINAYSNLLYLSKTFSVLTGVSSIALFSITADSYAIFGNENIDQQSSVLSGALKVISQEYFHVKTQNIDVCGKDLCAPAALARKLYELCSEDNQEPVIALRERDTVWVQCFQEMRVARPGKIQIMKNAVYLITGGLGNLGYLLARQLIGRGAAVAILGRAGLNDHDGHYDDEKRRKWDQLVALSSECLYFTVDITDPEAFHEAVRQIEKERGPVSGIFHLAAAGMGQKEQNLVANLSMEECIRQLSPKIDGVRNIKKLFPDYDLDFVVLFSSLASVLGGVGYFAYAAANAYLDRFALVNDGVHHTRWFALNWDAWDTGSDSASSPTAISAAEGDGIFCDLEGYLQNSQVIISINDLENRLNKWVRKQEVQASQHPTELPLLERQATSGSIVLPSNEIEESLLNIWKDLFGYQTIGVNEDFYELGGDSLKALSLVNRIRRHFEKEITLADFFGDPSIRGIARLIESKDTFDLSILPVSERSRYQLSAAQKRLFFLYAFEPGSLAYNMPKAVRIKGKPEMKKMEEALAGLIGRHEILRTAIRMEEDEPFQVVVKNVDFKIERLQANGKGADAVIKEFVRPFDLQAPPLLRAGILTLSEEEHILLFDMHHIVTDGSSQGILIHDLMALYNGRVLPEPARHYKDYAEWQQGEEGRKRTAAQKEFWLNMFAELPDVLALPSDHQRPAIKTHRGAALSFEINPEETVALKTLAEKESTTLFVVLLSVYNVFLSKLGNQEDIVVGVPVSGRRHADVEEMVGMFVNTLALRNQPRGDMRFIDFLRQVKKTTLTCFDNQDFQYEDLVEELAPGRDIRHNPLFDVVFVYDNFAPSMLDIPGLILEPFPVEQHTAKFDLVLAAIESGSRLLLSFEYSTDLFEETTIARFITYFKNSVAEILKNSNSVIGDLAYLPREEELELLAENDLTGVAYPSEATLHGLFDSQALRYPDRKALVFEGGTMSYGMLREESDRLARVLRASGVGRDTVVGLLTDRCPEMIVGMLGILKAGGAYLPMDSGFPMDRIHYLLSDSGAVLLLTTSVLAEGAYGVRTIFIGDALSMDALSMDAPEPEEGGVCTSGDLCYVLYTSGTTGYPKGVMIEHRQVVRLFFNASPLFSFGPEDVWTLFHNHYFDFSVWEMYGALLYGGRLVLVSKDVSRDPQAFLALVETQGVTVLNQTPSAFYNLAQAEEEGGVRALGLRYVIFGGEALKPGKLAGWHSRYPDVQLINMFGITETTVHVTYKRIGAAEIAGQVSNIGGPIPTLSVCLLDKYGKLVAGGVTGELYVGGAGVGRGYMHRPALTEERFVRHPYKAGERLYRSGDLCRRLANGELEYLGRMDHQVKIRGHRIELGEIENRLLEHPAVANVLVIAREDGGQQRLCAYIVTHEITEMDVLRNYLTGLLPAYMIPSWFIHMMALPMTSNGKVDRKRLPGPDQEEAGEHAAPVTALEASLSEVWSEVLHVERVGIHSNYFSLGGDSILAIRLVNVMNRRLGVKLRIADLFVHQTIAALGRLLEQGLESREGETALLRRQLEAHLRQERERFMLSSGLSPEQVADVYPASDIQQGMLYHSLREPGLYHDQMVHWVNYPPAHIARLEHALALLVARHAILRTAFYQWETGLQQVVFREQVPELHWHNLAERSPASQQRYIREALEADRGRPFVPERPGLFRLLVFILGGNRYCICLACHHAILDGWSDASFNTELNNLLAALSADASFRPGPLRSTYRDFIIEQLVSARLPELDAWWKQELEGYQRFSFGGRSELNVAQEREVLLPGVVLEQLERQAAACDSGVRQLCLTAFLYALQLFSYQKDITIGLVVNNRPEVEDGDKILGCFLNTVPLRVVMEAGKSWRELVSMISGKVNGQQRYESVSLRRIVAALGSSPGESNPVTDVLFNYVDFHVYKDLVGEAVTAAKAAGTQAETAGTAGEAMPLTGLTRNNALFNLNIERQPGGLRLSLSYTTRFAGDEVAVRFLEYVLRSLQAMSKDMESKAAVRTIMSAGEQHQLLHTFNDTAVAYEDDQTLLDLVAASVERRGEEIAIGCEGVTLTYRAAAEAAHGLAHCLHRRGLQPGDLVPVCVERSARMVTVLLGILEAGGVYVPIDVNHPRERNGYILEDIAGGLLIVEDQTQDRLETTGWEVINLDRIEWESGEQGAWRPSGADLAYVLYTSGTTGRPKGVMITHGSLYNFLRSMGTLLEAGDDMVLLSVTTYSFDISGLEFYLPLCAGGRLEVAGEATLQDVQRLRARIAGSGATHMQATPSRWQLLWESGWRNETGMVVLSGGEAISNRLKELLTGVSAEGIWNLYGPTETTIWSTACRLGTADAVTIGRPIANTGVYILDKALELLPVGEYGDLYLSGAGLSRGYYKREELTREKFLANPYATPGHERLYKTGDLARWRPDGRLEFAGRQDYQVKIRGYRIELEEIENVLRAYEHIEEAIVSAREGKEEEKYLVAYMVAGTILDIAAMRSSLAGKLPSYMVPGYFVQLEAFPLTPNGKIDRKNLPDPLEQELSRSTAYIAPRNEFEIKLASIWEDVLDLEDPGIHDDFFMMGGHSLNVTRLLSRIEKTFDIRLPLNDLFRRPILEDQARLIRQAVAAGKNEQASVAASTR